jgi:2-amino-4-hydroxy-6-hydroxymethyldihydropteridine diphosphokinase
LAIVKLAPVAIALGSNLGDRDQLLRDAAAALRPAVHDIRLSSFYDTAPVGVDADQPTFLNAALTGHTALTPRALLERLLALEQEFGRRRPYPGAPRTLDLDLILYGDAVIDEPPTLIVPHPRFRERLFVLDPLAEIAGEWIDPVTGKSVTALRDQASGLGLQGPG